jgi:hypothetical protein
LIPLRWRMSRQVSLLCLKTRGIANTLIYTQLVEFEGDDKYCSAITHNVEEAQKLIEIGFEYVYNHENVMLFRKRK